MSNYRFIPPAQKELICHLSLTLKPCLIAYPTGISALTVWQILRHWRLTSDTRKKALPMGCPRVLMDFHISVRGCISFPLHWKLILAIAMCRKLSTLKSVNAPFQTPWNLVGLHGKRYVSSLLVAFWDWDPWRYLVKVLSEMKHAKICTRPHLLNSHQKPLFSLMNQLVIDTHWIALMHGDLLVITHVSMTTLFGEHSVSLESSRADNTYDNTTGIPSFWQYSLKVWFTLMS